MEQAAPLEAFVLFNSAAMGLTLRMDTLTGDTWMLVRQRGRSRGRYAKVYEQFVWAPLDTHWPVAEAEQEQTSQEAGSYDTAMAG